MFCSDPDLKQHLSIGKEKDIKFIAQQALSAMSILVIDIETFVSIAA
jgi:hypothetical protein